MIVESRWQSIDDKAEHPAEPLYQVVTLRDGRIVEMQDCRSHKDALRYAKRRASAPV